MEQGGGRERGGQKCEGGDNCIQKPVKEQGKGYVYKWDPRNVTKNQRLAATSVCFLCLYMPSPPNTTLTPGQDSLTSFKNVLLGICQDVNTV